MNEYSPEAKYFGRRVKVELNLSSNATKSDLKCATGVNKSKLDKKLDLAGLKCNVWKLDIHKLKNVPSNLDSKVNKLDVDKLIPVLF